jgi:hypothetical protein
MGVWGATQWTRHTYEVTYGVYDTLAGNFTWQQLINGASFKPKGSPNPYIIRSADGGNLRTKTNSRRTSYGFNISTPLYPTQAAFFINAACTLITVSGRKQVQSFTADYFDGVEVQRCLGCRIRNATLTADNTRDYWMFEADGDFQKYDTPPTLTEPAASVFPAETPYEFQDSAGLVTLSSVVVGYKSLSIMIKNMLKPNFNESPTIQALDYTGRDVDWRIVKENTLAIGRTRFENRTAVAGSVGFAQASPAHSVTLNTQGKVYYNGRDVTRDFEDNQYETLDLIALKDPATGTDLVATIT